MLWLLVEAYGFLKDERAVDELMAKEQKACLHDEKDTEEKWVRWRHFHRRLRSCPYPSDLLRFAALLSLQATPTRDCSLTRPGQGYCFTRQGHVMLVCGVRLAERHCSPVCRVSRHPRFWGARLLPLELETELEEEEKKSQAADSELEKKKRQAAGSGDRRRSWMLQQSSRKLFQLEGDPKDKNSAASVAYQSHSIYNLTGAWLVFLGVTTLLAVGAVMTTGPWRYAFVYAVIVFVAANADRVAIMKNWVWSTQTGKISEDSLVDCVKMAMICGYHAVVHAVDYLDENFAATWPQSKSGTSEGGQGEDESMLRDGEISRRDRAVIMRAKAKYDQLR